MDPFLIGLKRENVNSLRLVADPLQEVLMYFLLAAFIYKDDHAGAGTTEHATQNWLIGQVGPQRLQVRYKAGSILLV